MPDLWPDRCAGCLLGLALGDALGAPYEGGPLEKAVWRGLALLRPAVLRYTDDTEMALGCAESLIACDGFDVDAMARTWAERMSPSRGYGPGAQRTLNLIRQGVPWNEAARRVYADGSFGNGAAMRAAPLGAWFAHDPAALDAAATQAAQVTHAHPLGWQGGLLLARAARQALLDEASLLDALNTPDLDDAYRRRLAQAEELLADEAEPAAVVAALGHSVAAHESAVTALYVACRFRHDDFALMMRFVVALGGDTDTIGAMAGAIWGACRGAGALPTADLERLEDRARIEAAGRGLARGRPEA